MNRAWHGLLDFVCLLFGNGEGVFAPESIKWIHVLKN